MPEITFTVNQDFLTRFVSAAKGLNPIPTHPEDPSDPGSPMIPDYTDAEWARIILRGLITGLVQRWEREEAIKAILPDDSGVTVTVT